MKSISIAIFFAVCSAVSAAEEIVRDDVIIVVEDKPSVPAPRVELVGSEAIAPREPLRRGDAYSSVWHHPEQAFVDSDIGPLPLWTETVYDANGNPQPRFPDVFTKNFLDNPSDATALAYLESSRTRARRYLEASQIMQKVAVDNHFVTPEAFRPPKEGLTNSRALTPPYTQTPENWGVPVFTPEQAHAAGLKPEEVPETPGRTTTRMVEVLFFWDYRCTYSMRGFRDFAAFGTDIFNRELGPRVITVSLDNDGVAAKTQLDFLEYNGVETHFMENWTDQTELRSRMNIRVTPTYVFIDRRRGRVTRYEGLKDRAFLQDALTELVDHRGAAWNEVDASWFRTVSPAAGAAHPADGTAPADSTPLPAGSTLVQPPSLKIKAWDPDGQSDR